jgi:hypothetical protein
MDMSRTYLCKDCNLEFKSFQNKANHIRWYHKSEDFYNASADILSIKAKLSNELRFGKIIKETIDCYKCSEQINIEFREGKRKEKYFCSRQCANSRTHSTASKHKTSLKVKSLWESGHYDDTTANNWKKLPKQFSSKREREIVEFFKNYYPEDIWKSGGQLKTDNLRLVRDLWSDKLKVCIEYDGDWHFIDIVGQLENKKQKDLALEVWCVKNAYRLIRIDSKENLSNEDIVNLVYNTYDPIIKIGNRY